MNRLTEAPRSIKKIPKETSKNAPVNNSGTTEIAHPVYDLNEPITVVSLTDIRMIKPDAKSNHSCPDASCPPDSCRVKATENNAESCAWTCPRSCPYGSCK